MSTLADRARGGPSPNSLAPSVQSDAAEVVRPGEALWLALAAGALSVAIGAYVSLGLHFFEKDAFSRVGNAYYALFSRDPHLGAIGFIWNPLPSLLELPLVALHPLWPGLVSMGFADVPISALFGGLSVYFLCKILALFDVSRGWRVIICLLYFLNPLILFYSSNGMSDIMLVGALLGCTDGVLRYAKQGSLRQLTAGAVWLALGFMIRYESVPFALCMGVGLAVGLLITGHDRRRIEGALLLLATPIAFAAMLWMYLNWLIMKRPLYFLNSSYGNAAQQGTGMYMASYHPLAFARHNLLYSLGFVAHFALLFWPVLLGLLGVAAVIASRRRDALGPALVGATIGIPALQVVMLYGGQSAGADRYFIYYIPFGFVLIAYLVSKLPRMQRPRAVVTMAVCVAVLLSGDVGTALAQRGGFLSYEDGPVLARIVAANRFHLFSASDRVIAYADSHPNLTILADAFDSYGVIMRARNPRQFVITSDLDFMSILENPRGRVDAILVPAPVGVSVLDAVNRTWPSMWSGRLSWAHEMANFGAYRLFAIGPSAP